MDERVKLAEIETAARRFQLPSENVGFVIQSSAFPRITDRDLHRVAPVA